MAAVYNRPLATEDYLTNPTNHGVIHMYFYEKYRLAPYSVCTSIMTIFYSSLCVFALHFQFLSQKMSIAEQEMKTAKESLLQTTAENSR